MKPSLFLCCLLILVLFSIRTTVNLLVPHPLCYAPCFCSPKMSLGDASLAVFRAASLSFIYTPNHLSAILCYYKQSHGKHLVLILCRDASILWDKVPDVDLLQWVCYVVKVMVSVEFCSLDISHCILHTANTFPVAT